MTAISDPDPLPDGQSPDRPSTPTRLRDRLREQTHAAILDAAEHTITEEGTALARIDAIAAAAGVSVGTLYNHFADRDALVGAVVEDRRRVLLGQLTELVDTPGGDFVQRLHQFFEIFTKLGARHGRFFAVVMGEQGGSRPWQCQRDETNAAFTDLSRRLLQQGVREGVVRWDRLDVYTGFLAALAKTAVAGTVAHAPPIATTDIVHFFLHGVSPSSDNVPAGDGSTL